MPKFNVAFFLALLLFGLNAQAQEKQYLKWGPYQFEVIHGLDSAVMASDQTIRQINTCRFADTTTRYHRLKFTQIDYVEINDSAKGEPVLTEVKTDSMPYNTTIGKIKAKDFLKLVKQPFVMPQSFGLEPFEVYAFILTEDTMKFGWSGYYGEIKGFDIKPGNHLLVGFEVTDKVTNTIQRIIGFVLVEII